MRPGPWIHSRTPLKGCKTAERENEKVGEEKKVEETTTSGVEEEPTV